MVNRLLNRRVLPTVATVAFKVALTLVLTLASPFTLEAQDPSKVEPLPRPGDKLDWYVVKEGDTLMDITIEYLGTHRLWEENWRLNPKIRDPRSMRIGRRIRVISERSPTSEDAEVTVVSRVVRTQRFPTRTEEEARVGDRLQEKDGIRTAESSSAELEFDPDSRLHIGEKSLIFLERVDSTLTGVKRESIEIRRGQAEVRARATTAKAKEIEILVGNARARPTADASGSLQVRSRRVGDSAAAKVMVYGGNSEVEAGGEKVDVPRGMGTAVPEEGPPSPPEKLLPAPRPELEEDSRWNYSNPEIRWRAIEGASSYDLELCSDSKCSKLFRRVEGLKKTSWTPERLPVQEFYWRVLAVSESGLDGYPSRPRSFAIESEKPDTKAPVVAVILEGAGHHRGPSQVVLAKSGRLRLEAMDDASGVAIVRYRWDSGPWKTWKGEALKPPKGLTGTAQLEVQAEDRRGSISPTKAVTVSFDFENPAPPVVEWTAEDSSATSH
ncbi:MAG: FecR domain-containing protein [Deltaproteobacteria bacterium]|nr:FecR domain-containing protein [Deltaproteobacteria bacterium]